MKIATRVLTATIHNISRPLRVSRNTLRSLAAVMGSQKSKSLTTTLTKGGIVLSSNCAVEVREAVVQSKVPTGFLQPHPVRLESQPQHSWEKAWQIEMEPREVVTFRVSYTTALPYENEQGPEYGDEWIYFYDDEGNTHTMNFSTLPQETRGMIFGDAYFYLYTRQNTEPEQLEIPEDNQLFTSQYFNSSNEIKVVTHGWFSHEKTEWLQEIKDAFLRKYDFNVITVDWSELAKNPAYPWSAFSTRYVGKKTATLLDSIARTYQVDGKVMHLMGHSLGSHVMGYTALFSNQRIHRITGLDPARPLFELPLMAPDYRLEKSDAEFVDIIHSCGGVYGYWRSHGHADFYPNNGRAKQPGCEGAQQVIEGCSHGRSTLFFAESIDSKIPFVAYPCENWKKFETGDCKENSVNMGYPVSTNIRGDYYLYTNGEPEFARGED